jgi:hypothetical protein
LYKNGAVYRSRNNLFQQHHNLYSAIKLFTIFFEIILNQKKYLHLLLIENNLKINLSIYNKPNKIDDDYINKS